MKAIIQQFQKELTAEERRLFEANAALAGRRPGLHLKCILFGEKHALTETTEGGKKRDRPTKTESRKGRGRRTKNGKTKPKSETED